MMAHELLRQAALIVGSNWSQGCSARDDAGSIVPLHIGAAINPAAVAVLALWRDLQGRQSEPERSIVTTLIVVAADGVAKEVFSAA
jgi:hypothetical protein